jgi:hypothetical protein
MPSEERKAFLLRIDPKLWGELEAWAGDELRSINGQIEFILREAVRRRQGRGEPAPAATAAGPAGTPPASS